MDPIKVTCPYCNKSFSIDEALGHQLSSEIEEKLKKEFNQKWVLQKEKLAEEAKKNAEGEMKLLREENEKRSKEAAEAREKEIGWIKEKRAFDEEKERFELEKQRQIEEERKKIREKVELEMVERYSMKEKEKDHVIDSLRKSLEEAQRKANQGSQQLQGEVQELELEGLLKINFPLDSIEPVGKGITGADVIQRIYDNTGRMCGAIVWESKRTKNWTEGWVQKLLDDRRSIKADVAILVSTVLPEGLKKFGPYDKIYVTGFENLLEVAKIIRLKIIELCYAKLSVEGKNDKKEILWSYLTGHEFKGRVEAMVEAFSMMRESVEKEKKFFANKWARDEKTIQRMTDNLLGMHGDIHGLVGTSLPEIKSLELATTDTVEDVGATLTLDFTESKLSV